MKMYVNQHSTHITAAKKTLAICHVLVRQRATQSCVKSHSAVLAKSVKAAKS